MSSHRLVSFALNNPKVTELVTNLPVDRASYLSEDQLRLIRKYFKGYCIREKYVTSHYQLNHVFLDSYSRTGEMISPNSPFILHTSLRTSSPLEILGVLSLLPRASWEDQVDPTIRGDPFRGIRMYGNIKLTYCIFDDEDTDFFLSLLVELLNGNQ